MKTILRISLVLCFAVLLLVLSANPAKAEVAYYIVNGIVLDENHIPIANARITVIQSTTNIEVASIFSDQDGHFFTRLEYGEYAFIAKPPLASGLESVFVLKRPVYKDTFVEIILLSSTAESAQTASQEESMQPIMQSFPMDSSTTHQLYGRVTNQSGDPLANTLIEVIDPTNNSVVVSASTDVSGNYTLSVGGRTYNIRVTPSAGSGLGVAIVLGRTIGADTELNVVLVPSGATTLSGRILNSLGEEVSGQRIGLSAFGTDNWLYYTTASDGFYSFSVSPGDYKINLEGDNNPDSLNVPRAYYIASRYWEGGILSLVENTLMDIVIPTQSVDIHVQDPLGNPVSGVGLTSSGPYINTMIGTVPAYGYSYYPYWQPPAVTDEFGNTTLWLFPATYTLTVTPPADSPFAIFNVADVVITADQSIVIVLQFVHPSPVTTLSLLESPNAADEYPDPTTVSLSAIAAEGYTIDTTYYRVDDVGQQSYTAPFTVSGGGSHTIEYWSVDNFGVFELPKTYTFNIVTNRPPEITSISAPIAPVPVGQSFNATVTFNDPDVGDTHSIKWEWGDGATTTVMATVPSVTTSHTYTTAGVYTITATITDAAGESDTESFQYVVIYDPNGGFVTGGGWINSPLGAYTPDPLLTGKATFGFVSKYQKGASVPTGNTEFQFHVANMNFKSISYDWLVIAGTKAQYKGTGTISGAGEYKFMLTAIDGSLDKFRIKIWDKVTGEVIYDNQLGASDTADPATAIQGGSIVIHKAK